MVFLNSSIEFQYSIEFVCLRGNGIGIGIGIDLGISMQFYENFSGRRQQGEHHRLRMLFQQKIHGNLGVACFPNSQTP